jgi:hypothetical protein
VFAVARFSVDRHCTLIVIAHTLRIAADTSDCPRAPVLIGRPYKS